MHASSVADKEEGARDGYHRKRNVAEKNQLETNISNGNRTR